MFAPQNRRSSFLVVGAVLMVAVFALARLVPRQHSTRLAYALQSTDPWTAAQVVEPADLAKQLADAKARKPLILCVGFSSLYNSARIPGAVFHGTPSSASGLDELKKWAQGIGREQPMVIYCGCCPLGRCPNVRPAFKALRELGFTHLKLLDLSTDFATDWVQKGLPVEKSK